jgi:hypothetical protein
MLSRFKHAALSVVGASANRPDREKLKAAIAARDAAQRAVVDSGDTERLQAVLDHADEAARMAADAAHRATEARRAWVLNGCPWTGTRELQALDDSAAQAARAAEAAGRDASAVRKSGALARAASVVQDAQADVRGAEDKISAAISVIIAEEAAPLLQRFERIAEEYRAVRAEVMGVRMTLAQPWDLTTKDKMNPAWEGERAIEAALTRATIQSWAKERDTAHAADFVEGERGRAAGMFEGLMAPWRDRAAQLRADPDSDA